MTKNKQNTVLKVLLSCVVMLAMSGCTDWDKAPEENAIVEVAQDSNAILEPIQVVGLGYDYIEIRSSGVDEDGIDHVEFYAINNGSAKSSTSKRVDGEVSFDIQVRLAGLVDNTVYELRTVCYSVDGKTKSIEKYSVKTFAKTPNDPSNDTSTATPDTEAPVMTLNGLAIITLTVGDVYTEQGVTVTDNVDTGLTATIWGDTVDTSTAGTYIVTYNVTDAAGNVATEVTRIVNVIEAINTAPVLNSVSVSSNTLVGDWTFYGIAKYWDEQVTFSANGSDAEWDSLRIVINGAVYSWNSASLNLNLAQDEIQTFNIKEYDWKEYSNEINIRIKWV